MHSPFISTIRRPMVKLLSDGIFQTESSDLQSGFRHSMRCVKQLVHSSLGFCSIAGMGLCCQSQTASTFKSGVSLEIRFLKDLQTIHMFFLTLHKLFLTRNLLTISCLRLTFVSVLAFRYSLLTRDLYCRFLYNDDDPLGRSASLSVGSKLQ